VREDREVEILCIEKRLVSKNILHLKTQFFVLNQKERSVPSSGARPTCTGDPGGAKLTHLRRSWAANEVHLELKHASVGLTNMIASMYGLPDK
jgi:hypothetical protein